MQSKKEKSHVACGSYNNNKDVIKHKRVHHESSRLYNR